MAHTPWSYAQNVFDNSTKNNFKKMLMVASDHDSKLAAQIADAAINTLYLFFHPLYLAYSNAYSAWQSAEAAWGGGTVTVGDLMSQLSADKIEEWDIAIQVVYKQKTGEYKALLPNGRAPFQTGAYELRIAAIQTLVANIGADAALAAVKADALAFHTTILAARNTQQGKEGLLSQKSDALELERVAVAEGMYFTLAGLMSKFYQNPIKVEEYYDLELIRNINQQAPGDVFDFELPANSHQDSGITFGEADKFLLQNTSDTTLFAGRVATEGDPLTTNLITVSANSTVGIAASEMGAAGELFITLQNKTVDPGSMTVTHVKAV